MFAAAVPPYLMKSDDNPDGPLTEEAASGMEQGLSEDRDAFFDDFITAFFTAGDDLKVSEEQRQDAVAHGQQSDQEAALGCMEAFATTDFRDDLTSVTVPTLVIHGDSDGTVPFEGSGKRTHEAIEGSELVVLEGAPARLQRQPRRRSSTARCSTSWADPTGGTAGTRGAAAGQAELRQRVGP